MIVTCPVCSTRYLVDPSALGPSGRLVRCAGCSHVWREAPPPEDVPRRIDLTPPPEPATAKPSSRPAQLPALPPRRRRRGSGMAAVAVVLYVVVLLGLAAGGLWLTREEVMAYWPGSTRYFALLGATPPVTPAGLRLDKIVASRDTENGLPTLVIQGEVMNVSRLPREVPKVKVVLEDSAKHQLQSWSFSVSDDPVRPGGTVPFRTSIAEPSEAATDVVVDFDAQN